MTDGIKTIIYPVTDIEKAKTLYAAFLGVQPTMDESYYVGYEVDGQHIGLDPNGHRSGMTGPVGYCQVADIAASVKTLVDAGAEVAQEPKDVGGGRQTALLKDADGNLIGVYQD